MPFQKGNKICLGQKASKETRKRQSETRKKRIKEGKITTAFKKGHTPWCKGKKLPPRSKTHCENLSKGLKGKVTWNKGRTDLPPISKEHKKKLDEGRKRACKEGIFNIKPNKPEKILIDIIKKHNLQFKYTGDGKFWIENINPDFVESNGKKIAIEIFGDYWHNPFKRKGLKWNRTVPGRKEIFKKYGWKSLILWDYEIQKGEDYILNKIKSL